ncbi:DUF481 domain-containing protein [Flavisolibacter tropicus]|uniref:DUF481 domain-containing protein n=1 Tax=Flavisolibacter tropicus TaxID=1492898 RepID=A0A172TQA7_9BACT|nr:DUF481 domain-containing protein [Flavisolibacter tropicus]ANE49210.1 hypothetical protein SY85_00510 [Flavisolibacter tropicus]
MFRQLQVIFVLIILSWQVDIHAQSRRDTLYLFNGQIFIGYVKGANLGVLTFDEMDLKYIKIRMYKIKRINTARRFKIETLDKHFYYGYLKPSSQENWVKIVSDEKDTIEMKITDLGVILALENKFLTRLNGSLSAGFSFTKANEEGQVNFSTNLYYPMKRFGHQLSLSTIGSIDSSKYSRDKEDGSLFSIYSVTPSWYLAGSFVYQRNLELSLARRYQELIGGGNKLVSKTDMQVLFTSGISFNQEKSTTGIINDLLLEVPVILKLNYFKYHQPNIQISSTNSAFFSLSQKDRVRFDANIYFSWELARRFYLTLSPYANYDSKPPEGDSNFDYGSAISISFQF